MWSKHLADVEAAKAKGIAYVAPEISFLNRLRDIVSPALQPEK